MVSDGDNSYIGFEEAHDIIHERITNYKEKSRNGYSLGPINSLHSSFKFMLSRYRGVSTKRLKGYINLFIVDFVLKQVLSKSEIIDYIYESLLDLNHSITNKKIENAKFPINIDGIFEELRQEGLIS